VLSDPLFVVLESRLLDLIRKSNLPAISGLTDFAEAGGLMAFGPNMASQFYRAAMYVDRILKGADAGELPVDRPTEFDLTLNLRAAKAIGLTFSLSLLGRADKVIE